jgi:hypothetical protein
MTINELVEELTARGLDPNADLMILDGFNGGGGPREINLITTRTITEADAAESGDCERRVGETVTVLGYGCY